MIWSYIHWVHEVLSYGWSARNGCEINISLILPGDQNFIADHEKINCKFWYLHNIYMFDTNQFSTIVLTIVRHW